MNNLAPLSKRVYALLIDGFIVVVAVFGFPALGVSGVAYAILVGAIFITYEPVCVSVWGQTLGHRAIGIRVVNEAGNTPSFFQALGRLIVKNILGIWSFLTMMVNGKAVHDMTTKTSVVLAKSDTQP